VFLLGLPASNRFDQTGRLAAVHLPDCAVVTSSLPYSLTQNSAPLWVPVLQGFIAEASRGDFYGPHLIRRSDPASPEPLLERASDPHLYSLSESGTLLAVGDHDETWVFRLSASGLRETASFPASDRLVACSDHVLSFTHAERAWRVRDAESGESIARIDSSADRLRCPSPAP
jgi:hypothetical protein